MGAPLPPGEATFAWSAVASALIDGLADAAWLVDAATLRLVAANRAAEAWLGVARGALCGLAVRDLMATPEDQAFWREVAEGIDPGPGLDSESFAHCATGGPRPVQRRIRRVQCSASVACFLVLMRDRSAEQQAEAEHASRLAQLNATLEATADGILVTDRNGRIVNFNHRFATLWALPPELAAHRDDDEVMAWLQRRMADPAGYMRRLAAIGEASDEATHDLLPLKNGDSVERASQPQRMAGGACFGRVWSFRLSPRDPAHNAPQCDSERPDVIYKFKSKATGDLIMTGPVGDQVLGIIGKSASASGIIAVAAMPAAIAAIEAAVAADVKPADAGDEGEDAAKGAGVGLRQRAWPLVEMMKRCQAENADIVWGV